MGFYIETSFDILFVSQELLLHDRKKLLTLGIFFLALLTFVFTLCK